MTGGEAGTDHDRSRCALGDGGADFAAGFIGEVNMLPARSLGGGRFEAAFGELRLESDLPPGEATLLIRPEHFREAGAAAMALGPAAVEDAAFFGTQVRAHLRLVGARIVAHFPQGARLAPGETVALSVDPARVTALAGRP